MPDKTNPMAVLIRIGAWPERTANSLLSIVYQPIITRIPREATIAPEATVQALRQSHAVLGFIFLNIFSTSIE
jgi:hypothetical protein